MKALPQIRDSRPALGAFVSANRKTSLADAEAKTEQLAEQIIANGYHDKYEQELGRIMEGRDYPLASHLKSILIDEIKRALADGAIITRPVPEFLRDVFESSAEGALRPLVNDGTYDRAVLEHIKTRAPWVVKGSTVHDLMILQMADEYDVFDQAGLIAYQNGSPVKRFFIVPIELIRNNGAQLTESNKDVVSHVFEANPDTTLVVNYRDAEVADGLDYNMQTHQRALPDSVRHISFVGKNVTSIGDEFLRDCDSLTLVDLRLKNVTSIGNDFLSDCNGLTSVDLSNVSEPGRSVICEALERNKRNCGRERIWNKILQKNKLAQKIANHTLHMHWHNNKTLADKFRLRADEHG